MLRSLVDHIHTVGGRYKGKIHSWDVVNEAIWIPDGRPDGLRSSSPWFQMLGPGYIDLAFRTARQADPTALLTYNDYSIEYDNDHEGKKRAAVLTLLRQMKADKVPLDALGIQSHLHAISNSGFDRSIRELIDGAKTLGLCVLFRENRLQFVARRTGNHPPSSIEHGEPWPSASRRGPGPGRRRPGRRRRFS